MEISYQEWVDWKNNPVTKAFYAACEERIEEGKEIAANSMGVDSDQDNFMRGFIFAYREMQEFRVDEDGND